LQALPPRQRGVFVLRDVLGRSAAETAAILEMSVGAVNSALQRARGAVRAGAPRPNRLQPGIVERYARAIEQGDSAALAALVADDVVFEMPPVPQWSIGRESYVAFMAHLFAWRGTRWATRPISANGQPGFLLSLVADDGPRPHTVQVFEADATGTAIGQVFVHQNARLFDLFEGDLAEVR
jgi:RNA polymerase sigma-70 factor (ECF subfamily)